MNGGRSATAWITTRKCVRSSRFVRVVDNALRFMRGRKSPAVRQGRVNPRTQTNTRESVRGFLPQPSAGFDCSAQTRNIRTEASVWDVR